MSQGIIDDWYEALNKGEFVMVFLFFFFFFVDIKRASTPSIMQYSCKS